MSEEGERLLKGEDQGEAMYERYRTPKTYFDPKASSYDASSSDDDADPDTLLRRIADETFTEISPRTTLPTRIQAWYKPIYDYKTPGLTWEQRRIPRYCNGRLKRWQFWMLNLVVFALLFGLVFGLLAYFVIVPAVIQVRERKTAGIFALS